MVSSHDQHHASTTRRRRREARRALVAALKHIRAGCKACDTAEAWLAHLQPLQDSLQKYGDELETQLTLEQRARLEEAMRLGDASREGIEKACDALEKELELTSKLLPAGLALSPLLIIAVILGAVAAGGAATYLAATDVEVEVANENCPDLTFSAPGVLPLILGLPQGPLGRGEKAAIRLRPGALGLDATRRGVLAATAMGQSVGVDIPPNVTALRLDGSSLLGRSVRESLNAGSHHELVVTCR